MTDPTHDAIRKVMAAFRTPAEVPAADIDVEARDLATYDQALQVPLW